MMEWEVAKEGGWSRLNASVTLREEYVCIIHVCICAYVHVYVSMYVYVCAYCHDWTISLAQEYFF